MKGLMKGLLFGVVFGTALILERRRPLRRRVDPHVARRVTRNAALGGSAVVFSAAVEWLIVQHAGAWAERRRIGLLRRLPLPLAAARVAGFLALDYSIYVWHVLNHRLAGLWRFHLVHHVDRDLDASTGLRFHFGELALTALLRLTQVLIIGPDRQTLAWWQRLLTASVVFHHSNLRLPMRLERPLSRVLVTPRMHGIHHSERHQETDSNYASLLSVWDVLHGTLLLNVPQEMITIGVPAWRDPDELTLGPMLVLPFGPQRDSWAETKALPARHAPGVPVAVLAE